MRKKLLALVCCCGLLLVACGGPAGPVSGPDSGTQSAPPAASQAPEPGEAAAEPLRVLKDGNRYADDVPGSVERQQLANDSGDILLYTNYATATQAPLCALGGCPHNSGACNAYLPPAWAGDQMVIAGGYVFVVDAHSGSSLNELDMQFFMVRYALDGSGGELVFDIPGLFTMSDAVLTDGKYLYFDIGNWSETEDVEYGGWRIGAWETYLIRVDINTGAIENVRPMTSRSLIGVAEGRILMWDTSTEPASLVAYALEEDRETPLGTLPAEMAEMDTDDPSVLYDGLIYGTYRDAEKNFHLMAYDPFEGAVAFDIQRERSISMDFACGGYIGSTQKNLAYEKGEGSGTSYPDKSPYYTWVYFDARTGQQLEMPLYVEYEAPRPLNANFEDSATVDGQAALLFGTCNGQYILSSGYYLVPYYDAVIDEDLYFPRDTYSVIQPGDYWAGSGTRQEIAPCMINTTGEPVEKVTEEQQRLFAFGAVLAQRNHFGYGRASIFSPYARQSTRAQYAAVLVDSWGISDRASALDSLDWLVKTGHRSTVGNSQGLNDYMEIMLNFDKLPAVQQAAYDQAKTAFDSMMAEMAQLGYQETPALSAEDLAGVKTLSAWDYDRLVTVARWCYSLGYIAEDEMYAYLEFAAEKAVQEYGNWNQYFAAVIIGRTLWSGTGQVHADEDALAYELLEMENSIYNRVAFLGPGERL